MTTRREPPTASNGRVDVSVPGPRASAVPSGSPREDALFHGYRHPAPVEVEQPCVCGGVIRAVFGDWGSAAAAIRCHQELTIHRLWRDRVGIE